MKAKKPRKAKAVAYELLDREIPIYMAMYKLLDTLVTQHHRELIPAKIALAWCTSWRRDIDGHQVLGKCRKASDLDRELAVWDFVILLQKDFYTDPLVDDAKRAALLDHELCHATVKLDPQTNDPMEDERGRVVFRLRRHDLEEFAEIAERHGTWKRDIERFAQALRRGPQQSELPMESPEPHAATVN